LAHATLSDPAPASITDATLCAAGLLAAAALTVGRADDLWRGGRRPRG
jgi:hypothetical protein